jgi:hypothetical protein
MPIRCVIGGSVSWPGARGSGFDLRRALRADGEFYLAGSEMAFTHENFFIFQMQLTRKRMTVPDNRGLHH